MGGFSLLTFLAANIICSCYCLEASVEPLKVFFTPGKCSEIFVSEIDKYTPLLTTNTNDAKAYCSEYEFNSALSNSVRHCIDQSHECEENITVEGELKIKLQELSEYIKTIPHSCNDITLTNESPKSGYHLIQAPNNSVIEVYCDFDLSLTGKTGWIKVIGLNMTQPDSTCPDGLFEYYFASATHLLCDREHFYGAHCDSTFIPTHGLQFSTVAGRVHGYRQGYGGLDGIYDNLGGQPYIDGVYVDGVSLTYGQPRQHIWTFVGGQGETDNAWEDCPCNIGSSQQTLDFVGNDYYCEAMGIADDILWDGNDCGNLEGPCCTNPNLPYFVKELNKNVTENIELRICTSEGYPDESTPLHLIEIYIQ